MQNTNMKNIYYKILSVLCITILLMTYTSIKTNLNAENLSELSESIEVGVARIDITPTGPIRLSGYGNRRTESEGILQRLEAKALAIGSDEEDPALFITVDLIGIPGHITNKIKNRLAEKIDFNPAHLIISSSHTHTGPEVGLLLNHFGEPLPKDQLGRIAVYLDELTSKLEDVALMALDNRQPSLIDFGQGEVGFAMNRRDVRNDDSVRMVPVPEAPVDHAMPLLRVRNLDGALTAILVNYACHGTTLGPDINEMHNDWMGEAQRIIEERYPGVVAMVSIGAGADANPEPRLKLEHTTQHGKEIADEVDRLLSSSLQPLTASPVGHYKEIELPYAHVPSVEELIEQTAESGARGYYAIVALERIARGESIPESLTYPIQTWRFGEDLAMVFLPGEVVVDYSLRLKDELGDDQLWVTAYVNDVPSYIASRRVIQEGGYEVESSMFSYDRPSRYVEDIEDMIVETVHELLSR
jgi:hypothetical protein